MADRRSLIETGTPITGDSVVNMSHGPVLSSVYDCVKDPEPDYPSWKASFLEDGYDLVSVADPGDSELAEYDVELLQGLHSRYQSYTLRQIIGAAHELPEWKDPAPDKSVCVSPDEILRAIRLSSKRLRAYEDLNASVRQFDAVRVIRE